jgi:hypothetical protein
VLAFELNNFSKYNFYDFIAALFFKKVNFMQEQLWVKIFSPLKKFPRFFYPIPYRINLKQPKTNFLPILHTISCHFRVNPNLVLDKDSRYRM